MFEKHLKKSHCQRDFFCVMACVQKGALFLCLHSRVRAFLRARRFITKAEQIEIFRVIFKHSARDTNSKERSPVKSNLTCLVIFMTKEIFVPIFLIKRSVEITNIRFLQS